MTTLVNSGNGFQLPPNMTSSYDPKSTALTINMPDKPSYNSLVPTGNPMPQNNPAPSGPMSVTDLLTTILKQAQTNNGNQYTGNNTALLAGKEAVQGTNAGVYNQDLNNANLTNEARLSLLNNDQNLQSPGLKSITDQQSMNEHHYTETNDAIKAAQDAYDKAQALAEKTANDLAQLKQKGNNVTFDEQGNVAATSQKFSSIKGKDGYIDPYVWSNARDLWQAHGGSDASFVSNFKRFVNPESYDLVGIGTAGGA